MSRPSARKRTICDVLGPLDDEERPATTDQSEVRSLAHQVRTHRSVDQEKVSLYGITYQKCGGGFRIIRRQRRTY
jgi:hypothetical protein